MLIVCCQCFSLNPSAFQQECHEESHEEDDGGAEHDGQIGVQVDARQLPEVGQRNPADDQYAADAAQQCRPGRDALRDAPQEEQSQHAAGEDAGECPPGIDDALHAQHGDGHTGSQDAYAETGEAHDGQLQLLVLMVVLRVVMTQLVCYIASLEEEGAHIVGQYNRGRRGDRGRHGAHAGSKDAGDEQTAQSDGQPVDDEVGEDIVGLGLYLCGQRDHTSLIVAVEGTADEEEQCGDGDEEIAAEEGREAGILVGLGRMVTLHVVLVDAVVLQIDEDAVDEAYPEGRRGEVAGKRAQRELVAHGRVGGQLKGLHGALGHGEHEDSQTQHGSANEDDALDGIGPDDGLQPAHHRVDDDADGGEDDDGVHVPPHEDVHRHGQQIEYRPHAGNLRQQIAGRGIQPGPGPELLFQEGVGRHAAAVPIEGHEVLGGEIRGNGYRQREHKGVPVGGKGLAGVADVGDAADVGGEYRHAHHPAGYRVPCRREFIGTAALLEERAAEHHHAEGEDQEYYEVNYMHCFSYICSFPFWMGRALRASCIFWRSGASNL